MKESEGTPRAKAAAINRAGSISINMIYLNYECKREVVGNRSDSASDGGGRGFVTT